MKKRYLAVAALATMAAIALVACNNSSEKETETEKTTTTTTEETTTKTPEETTTKEPETTTEEETTTEKKEVVITGVYSPDFTDIQITVTKSGDVITVKGDGMKGDKFGEFEGTLSEVSENKYELIDGDNKMEFEFAEGTIKVVQTGNFGDEGFSFAGSYNKLRDVTQ